MKAQKYLEKYLKTNCPLQEKKDITILDIGKNDLTGSLNLIGFTSLETVICNNNKISSLNISQCPNLKMMDFSHNRLSSLNMTGLTNLLMLSCDNNYLSNLKLTGCSKLQVLSCFNNYLTRLDFLNDLSVESMKELLIDNNRFINDNSTPFDLTPFSGFVNLQVLKLGNWGPKKTKKNMNHFAGSTKPLQNLTNLEILYIENTGIELRQLPKSVKEVRCSSHENKQLEEQTTQIGFSHKSND